MSLPQKPQWEQHRCAPSSLTEFIKQTEWRVIVTSQRLHSLLNRHSVATGVQRNRPTTDGNRRTRNNNKQSVISLISAHSVTLIFFFFISAGASWSGNGFTSHLYNYHRHHGNRGTREAGDLRRKSNRSESTAGKWRHTEIFSPQSISKRRKTMIEASLNTDQLRESLHVAGEELLYYNHYNTLNTILSLNKISVIDWNTEAVRVWVLLCICQWFVIRFPHVIGCSESFRLRLSMWLCHYPSNEDKSL